MGKKILDSKILYAFLAIVIAIFLWFYVMSIDGNVMPNTIHNIPVTFVGQEALEAKGLMVVEDDQTANLTVRATPRILAQLTNESVQLVVDVASYDSATTYTNVAKVTLSRLKLLCTESGRWRSGAALQEVWQRDICLEMKRTLCSRQKPCWSAGRRAWSTKWPMRW